MRSLNDSQGKVNQQDISLGPAYESLQLALEEAVNAFEKELNSLASKMTYDSPATQPNIADLDRTMDEMKLAITQSLNDWVTLQDEIKDGISKLATANWINPLSGLSQKEAR